MYERADRLQNRPSTPDRNDGRGAASAPNPASDDNAMPARTGAERSTPAMAVTGIAPRLPPGADPDAVRDWFDFETIVSLPAPALSFAAADAAAADYRRAARADNTRRAYRTAVARFTDWCAEHAQTALPAAPETVAAFLAAEAGNGLAVNTLRLRHAALRYLHLLAGYPPPTAVAAGQRHLCRHPPRPSPAVAQKDRPGARPAARRRPRDPRQFARAA